MTPGVFVVLGIEPRVSYLLGNCLSIGTCAHQPFLLILLLLGNVGDKQMWMSPRGHHAQSPVLTEPSYCDSY